MNANELMDRLSQVFPDSEVKIVTSKGVFWIEEVRTFGYSRGTVSIVTGD